MLRSRSILIILAVPYAISVRRADSKISVTGAGTMSRERNSHETEALLFGFELMVVRAFKPKPYELDYLALSVGDRVSLTYDPRAEHHVAETYSNQYVYGVNEATREHGWFPVSYTNITGGSSMIEALDPQGCKNSYFSDWGSSGMKLVKVHTGVPAAEGGTPFAGKVNEKLQPLPGDISAKTLKEAIQPKCTELTTYDKNNFAKETWRIYATAGLRLHVDNANNMWKSLREDINVQPPCKGLLAECNAGTNKGCQTIPGAVEALYEMDSFFSLYDDSQLSKKQGWMSAGGASLQLGFFGFESDQLTTCLNSLDKLWLEENKKGVPEYDAHPGMVGTEGELFQQVFEKGVVGSGTLKNGQKVLLYSFLAVENDEITCDKEEDNCDHRAGGVNEMRKRFEQWMILENKRKDGYKEDDKSTWKYQANPCLEASASSGKGHAPFPLKFDSDVWSERLEGGIPHTDFEKDLKEIAIMDKCYQALDAFFDSDKSVQAWRAGGCTQLVEEAESFGFMTAFSRAVDEFQECGDCLKEKMVKDSMNKCSSVENGKKRFACGTLFTNALLLRWVHSVGWKEGIKKVILPANDADWADTPMRLNGLKKGWCPKTG